MASTGGQHSPSLSDSQVKVLSILLVVSGLVSVCGSCLILYRVVKKGWQKSTSYDRILFGLSCYDIILSMTFVLDPFLLPSETSTRVWALGSDGTCTALGVLAQCGVGALWYNGILAFYYLLTVRFGVSRQTFARRYEPCLHGFVLLFSLTTSLTGLGLGIYAELPIGMACHVPSDALGCTDDVSDLCAVDLILLIFLIWPWLTVLILLPVANLIIFFYVRNTLRREGNNARTASQKEQIKEVATQGFLYVFSFGMSYIPFVVVGVYEELGYVQKDEASIYPLLVIYSILPPLQGALNAVIFLRPNYTRVRAAFPDKSLGWVLRRACSDTEVPSLQSTLDSGDSGRGVNSGRASNFTSNLQRISEGGESSQGTLRSKLNEAQSKNKEKPITTESLAS